MTLQGLLDQAENFKDTHFAWFVGIMYVSFLVNSALVLPLYSVLSIIYAFIIDDFILGSVLLGLLPVLVTLTLYLTVSNQLIPYIRTKLHRFESFRDLDHNIDASSYAICIVIRFLYIPVGLKEYTILVLRYPFRANLLSSVLYYSVHGIIFAGIGSQLHNVRQMFETGYWTDMTIEQKLDLVLVLVSITFTVMVFVYITFWLKRKVMKDNNIDLTSVIDEGDEMGDENDERNRLID